ncbi:MAG: hypothetical protein ACHQFW_02950 [Chitinophagales bacterium]
MSVKKLLFLFIPIVITKLSITQVPTVKEVAISKTSFYEYGDEQLFPLKKGGAYYTMCDAPGYYIEKFDDQLKPLKSISKGFESESLENTFTQAIMLHDQLFLITGKFDKKEKQTDIKIIGINPTTLVTENGKSLLKLDGRVDWVTVSKSESDNFFSLVQIITDKKNAEIAIALFDSEMSQVYFKQYATDLENYAFAGKTIETGDDGNVYIESMIYTQRVINPGKEIHKIFCFPASGKTMHVVDFPQYQFGAAIDAQPDGKVFTYMITSKGMESFLVNGATGRIENEKPVNIDLSVWKESAWYTDNKSKPVGMFFLPIFTGHDKEGNIYAVGEQSVSGDAGGPYTDYYSIAVIKYNPELNQEWIKIIPKIQSSSMAVLKTLSIQGIQTNDTIDLFLNYSAEAFKLDIYTNGDLGRDDLKNVREVGNSDKTNDLVQVRILPDGKINYYKIADNTIVAYGYGTQTNMKGQTFKIGSAAGTSTDYYYIKDSFYDYKAGMRVGKKSLGHVMW